MGIETGTATLIAGGLGAGTSLLGGLMGGDDEGNYDLEQQAKMQTNIASYMWSRYKHKFKPLEDKLVKEASLPVEQQPGYLKAVGGLERGYANTGANLRRTLAGRYPSGGGLEVLPQSTLALQKPRARAGVYSDFSQARLGNMLNVAGLGRGLMGQAQSGLSSAAGIYGNLANINLANQQQQAGAWGSVGAGLGNLAQLYMLLNAGKKPGYPPVDSEWSGYYSPAQ